MTMPIDLVLVRHGQSEGNKASRLAEAGDATDASLRVLRDRHTSYWRLTDQGCRQARHAGAWLRRTFGDNPTVPFGRCCVSEFVRAKETAGLLGLHGARWYTDYNLTERDWGELGRCDMRERRARFSDALERRDHEPFFWRPAGGESFADLCHRLRAPLSTWHRECFDGSVIAVCHGEVMRGFEVLLERMTQEEFRRRVLSHDPSDRIHNCQINWYSRRNPTTGALERRVNWIRRVRPAETPLWDTGWQCIERATYSNDELLAEARRFERMLS